MKLFYSIIGLLMFSGITLAAEGAEAEAQVCCQATQDCKRRGPLRQCKTCEDGTQGTPYCGKGECNIFGCNCDGGCR